jgi:hypothetical protein
MPARRTLTGPQLTVLSEWSFEAVFDCQGCPTTFYGHLDCGVGMRESPFPSKHESDGIGFS